MKLGEETFIFLNFGDHHEFWSVENFGVYNILIQPEFFENELMHEGFSI